ncbi:MAG TPA: hypothetical protein VK602_19010 [Phyllobacterium sp.]|nr:hypothetical protein [Phyllobacterium sp.]
MRPLFDNKAFIEWIGRQNPEGRYVFDSCQSCLIARYLKSRGIDKVWVEMTFVTINSKSSSLLPEGWNAVAMGKGHTYGKALERAQRLLA